jgi:leucyl aminopeptidase
MIAKTACVVMGAATAAALALAAGCSTSPEAAPLPPADEIDAAEETGPRWISIDADALDTVREVLARGVTGAALPREIVDGVALLEVDARDLRALSSAMHEAHGRCGGFMLHDGLAEGRDALRAGVRQALAAPFAPSYVLDHGAAVQKVLPALDAASLLATIQQLSSLPTRYYTSSTGIAVASTLRDKWAGYASAGGRSDVQVSLFTHAGFPQPSVIATIPGTTKASEVVVLGGHLDSISSNMNAAPGADDDASGIATLTEILRVLLAKDFKPERTVRFIAYAAEEVGLRGSKGVVADAQAKSVNVVGVLQLDMTNFKGSQKDIYLIQDFTNGAQNTFVGNLIDAYVGATWGTDVCGYACSDHASWTNAGYPASMPAEALFADTNPSLHTPNDTLAMSGNNASHAIKFAKLGAAFAIELGKGTVGPPNRLPVVAIEAPKVAGRVVMLAGTATDDEDGALSDRLAWRSSVDGDLGIGATKTVTLSVGTHVITATVQDSAGAATSATASVEVTVGGDGDGGDGGAGAGCAAGGGGGGGAGLLAVAMAALVGVAGPRRRRRR